MQNPSQLPLLKGENDKGERYGFFANAQNDKGRENIFNLSPSGYSPFTLLKSADQAIV
jgi:hypothetical protein